MTQSYSTYLSSKLSQPIDLLRQGVFEFQSGRKSVDLVGVVSKFDKFADKPARAVIDVIVPDNTYPPRIGSICRPCGIHAGEYCYIVTGTDLYVAEPKAGFCRISITVEGSHQPQPKPEFEVLDF
jgi:hypothetical protein